MGVPGGGGGGGMFEGQPGSRTSLTDGQHVPQLPICGLAPGP